VTAFNSNTNLTNKATNNIYPNLDNATNNVPNNTSNNNFDPSLQLSPVSRPSHRPAASFGASVTIVAFEAPAPFVSLCFPFLLPFSHLHMCIKILDCFHAFPDLSHSHPSFDCTWEKQLLSAIENEKETRARELREREARLAIQPSTHLQVIPSKL
jgi:hypothetical protein